MAEGLLVSLIILLVVAAIVYIVLVHIPIPEPYRWIVYLIVGLIFLIWLLRILGVLT